MVAMKDSRVRLRPETSEKFRAIATFKRWTMTETADAIADAYIQQNAVPVAAPPSLPSNGAARKGRPDSIRSDQHDQHRREDAPGDSVVAASVPSQKKTAKAA